MHDKGYDNGREDRINGRSYNDYCSPSLNNVLGCAAYKLGYSIGWNAAGALLVDKIIVEIMRIVEKIIKDIMLMKDIMMKIKMMIMMMMMITGNFFLFLKESNIFYLF